jgi:hypothetical protein
VFESEFCHMGQFVTSLGKILLARAHVNQAFHPSGVNKLEPALAGG